MVDIGSFIARAIEWAVVPFILLLLLGYGFFQLPQEPVGEAAKSAARSARWVGLILFVLFILWRQGRGDAFFGTMPDFRFEFEFLVITAIAVAIGFGSSLFLDFVEGTNAFPLVVLLLVALMSITLYTYLFIWASRSLIPFLALGFAMGALLNRAFTTTRLKTPDGK